MESFYYAFGGADLYLTLDLPDVATAAAISMSIKQIAKANGLPTVVRPDHICFGS